MNLQDKILQILEEKHKKSGGHCGTYGVELRDMTGEDWQAVRNELKVLYTENKIEVRDGSKGKLFFLKKENRKRKVG